MRHNQGAEQNAAQEFRLPPPNGRNPGTWRVLLLLAPSLVYAVAFLLTGYGSAMGCILAAAIFPLGLVVWTLVHTLSPVSKVGVIVGSDGILVRGRFVPYAKIVEVVHERRARHAGGSHGDNSWEPSDEWIVRLRLIGGVELDLGTRSVDFEADDVGGAELVRVIQAAQESWAEAHLARVADDDLAVIAREGRTVIDWLYRLRELGSEGRQSYRDRQIDAERLSTALTDSCTKPSTRVAAAVALAASGDATTLKKLRIVAASVAHARLRVALETVADARDDAAIAEALQALDEVESEARHSRLSGGEQDHAGQTRRRHED